MQEQIAIKSGYQVSMHDRWWIHLTWDNFSNKFIWSKINYCQETLWKFHLKRVKKGELTAMNSLHSGLQNKDTYYLNQFYLRISNIDNSYKKHPSTGHRTAANSILRGGWQTLERPPFFETPQLTGELCFQVSCKAHHKLVHVLNPAASVHMTTLTDQEQRRTHTIQHSQQLTKGEGKYKYRFT